MKNILVVGGTGVLGKELVAQLLKKGKNVFVLTRNPKKNVALSAAGAVLLEGDLTDSASLKKACKGIDAVISSAHSLLGKGRYASEKVDDMGQKALINAANTEGVSHFTFVSVIGAAPNHEIDFWRRKWHIEQAVQGSGLTYNIIRASAFMEFHIGEMMGKSIFEKGKVTVFGKGKNPTNFVSVKDVAHLIIQCMDNPDKHNQLYEIGGLDNLTRLEIIEKYAEITGKSLKINHISSSVLKIMSKVMKPFHGGISRVMAVSDTFDRTDQSFDVNPLLKEFPMEMTRISDFIKKS
jgi:NADH dehydrogenase